MLDDKRLYWKIGNNEPSTNASLPLDSCLAFIHEIKDLNLEFTLEARMERERPCVGLVYECMVSITNINNGIKEPTCQYLNCNSDHILIFGGYVKVRESLYA